MSIRNIVPFALAVAGLNPLVAQTAKPDGADAQLQDLLELLNTPVVSASRTAERLSDAPATVIVINRSDIVKRGYTDVSQILNDLPGMQVVRPFGDSQLKNYWRGYRSFIGDPYLLMVDGLVQNSLFYNMNENTMVTVPLSNVDRIEVVYGPASALYGPNAFMGVINVITRKTQEYSGTLGAGNNQHRFADVSYSTGSGDVQFSATIRYDTSLVDDKTSEAYEFTKAHYLEDRQLWGAYVDNRNVAGSGNSQNNKVAVDLRLKYKTFEVGYQYYDLATGYGNEYAFDHAQNAGLWKRRETSFYLKHSQDFAYNFTGATLVRYRESNVPGDSVFIWGGSGSRGTGYGLYQALNNSMAFSQDFNWKPMTSLALAFGLKFEKKDLQKDYDQSWSDHWTVPGPNENLYPEPLISVAQPWNRKLQTIEGLYAQARWFFNENNSVILGGRRDKNSDFGSADTIRAGYVANFGGLSVKALFGQAYQEPTPRLLYAGWSGSGSNPGLKPETSDTIELSVGYTLSKYSITGSYWNTKNKNGILGSPGGARNLGDRTLNGVDIHLRTQQPTPWGGSLSAWGYLSFLLSNKGSNNPDPVTHVIDNDGLTRDGKVGDLANTQVMVGATLDLPWKGQSLTLLSRYVGARDTVYTNPVPSVDSHFVADLIYHAKDLFKPGLGLTFKISNLTDKTYFHPGVAQAGAGTTPGAWVNGSWERSGGDYSSLLAQPGREVTVSLNIRF